MNVVSSLENNKEGEVDMEDFKEIVYEQLPIKLTKFLETLTDEDLEQLSKIDKNLVARIYQAGVVFSIEIMNELKAEL